MIKYQYTLLVLFNVFYTKTVAWTVESDGIGGRQIINLGPWFSGQFAFLLLRIIGLKHL